MRILVCSGNPAAAFTLGAVQRSIHRSQKRRTRRPMLWKNSDTERKGNCRNALSIELDVELSGMIANQFSALACHIPGCIRQDEDELIAAIPAGNVLATDLPEQ